MKMPNLKYSTNIAQTSRPAHNPCEGVLQYWKIDRNKNRRRGEYE